MKRILVLADVDWSAPGAGNCDHYLREVLTRIAAAGHYVALITHDHWFLPWRRGRRPKIETLDGVKVARLGPRRFYGFMVAMLIARMARRGKLQRRFDAIIDCLCASPRALDRPDHPPSIPLVFELPKTWSSADVFAGPVIAATQHARQALRAAGFPKTHIVQAPFAATPVELNPFETESYKLAFGASVERLTLRALRRLKKQGIEPRVAPLNEHGPIAPEIACVVLGPGEECRALDAVARGAITLCPDTALGREFLEDGQIGLLYRPGDVAHLTQCLERIYTNEVLRQRFTEVARLRPTPVSWDKTAGLVLAAIEIIEAARAEGSAKRDS